MHFLDTPPENFPGKEFSLQWGVPESPEYIYEINYVDYGTTTSRETVTLPDIWYRALTELRRGDYQQPYLDSGAPKIGIELLNETQQRALEIAGDIEVRRQLQDPTLNTFASLRRLARDKNGLLYVCAGEEGSPLHGNEPFAAVKKVSKLGVIDFATSTRGYYGFFRYDEADFDAFVPPELKDSANAYAFADEPRIAVGPKGEHDFQIARLLLLQVETDMDYPLDALDIRNGL